MKGLLLKDWYALKSYCRSYLFIIIIFSVIGSAAHGNLFLIYYSCMFSGSITTISLMSYEERDKWERYASTLPYTKAQLVSGKYMLSLFLGLGCVLINLIVQFICMVVRNTYDINGLMSLLFVLVPFALLPVAFLMPFIFRFGVSKGRVAYYIVIAVLAVIIGFVETGDAISLINSESVFSAYISIIILIISLVIYALSWLLSIYLYKNRKN